MTTEVELNDFVLSSQNPDRKEPTRLTNIIVNPIKPAFLSCPGKNSKMMGLSNVPMAQLHPEEIPGIEMRDTQNSITVKFSGHVYVNETASILNVFHHTFNLILIIMQNIDRIKQ